MIGLVGLDGWPYSGWFTHISGYPSAAGRAQDRESSPAKDRRSTTVPRNQHHLNADYGHLRLRDTSPTRQFDYILDSSLFLLYKLSSRRSIS